MIENSSILLKNPIITRLYTIFCNKKQNHFYFFSKPVTIGTNPRSLVYQRLFAQICIFEQDTIGYKRYKSLKKQGFATV
jgi:hypothetical protein